MSEDYSRGYNLSNLKTLLSFTGKVKRDGFDEKFLQIFDFFDLNKNGEIDKSELNEILGKTQTYGASKDKSIFDQDEAAKFINTYKNKDNKTLQQLGINTEKLFNFIDNLKNTISKSINNTVIKQNLEIIGMNSYREIALWLCRQEEKSPSEETVQKKEKELKELNKNSNPPLVDGKLHGKFIRVSIKNSGIKNVSKYISNRMSQSIKGMQWNASGIKKLQQKFDKGEINKYNIVNILDDFNYTKNQNGDVEKQTKLKDSSIIDAIISETEWGDNSNKIKLMTSIIDTLAQAAQAVGVPQNDTDKLVKDFKTEMNKQMEFFQGSGIASADAQTMENIMETLIALIKNPISAEDNDTDYEMTQRFAQENQTFVSGNVEQIAYTTAEEFYNIVDNNHGSDSLSKLKELVNDKTKFNTKTIVDIITAYNTSGIGQDDKDIIDSILSESHKNTTPTVNHQNKTYLAHGNAYDVIYKMTNLLKEAAKEKGVPERFITQARVEWMREMYDLKENGSNRLEEHEIHMRYINKLIDLIGGKTTGAQGTYDDARAGDSKIGLGIDTIFGLFGCKTMEDMEAKLGEHSGAAKELLRIADEIKKAETDEEKANLMTEFKAQYKAIFKVDYNPQMIQAREELQERVAKIDIYNALEPIFNQIKYAGEMKDIKSILDSCKTVVGVTDDGKNIYLMELVEEQASLLLLGLQFAEKTSVTIGDETYEMETPEDVYKFILSQMEAGYKAEAESAKEGTTYAQMQKDLLQLNQAVYGTENIGKEVAKFNQNQAMTQQYSELLVDIGATIATCWIPGLGEAAGAKMLTTFGNLAIKSTKFAKMYKTLATAGKGLYEASRAVKAVQTGQAIGKTVQSGDKIVRFVKVGNKTFELGKVANLSLTTAISGAYNAVTSGTVVTGIHLLDGHNFEDSFEAGKGMAIFGMVSAAGSFAGKIAAGIASKMGCTLEVAQKSLAFVIEQGSVFGFANYETVAAYIKEKQKADPDFDFSKMSMEELWNVLVSDENIINNLIMLTMTVVTHATQKIAERAKANKPNETLVEFPDNFTVVDYKTAQKCKHLYIEQVKKSNSPHYIGDLQVEKTKAEDGSTIFVVKEYAGGKVIGERKYTIIGNEMREIVTLRRKTLDDLPQKDKESVMRASKTRASYEDTIRECENGGKQADALYEKYLDEQNADKQTKELCKKINNEFGMKIFFCDFIDGTTDGLRKIYQLLSILKKCSIDNGGELNIPKTLEPPPFEDLCTNIGGTADKANNRINIYSIAYEDLLEILLHELIHYQDPKLIQGYPPNFDKARVAQELKNAGLDEFLINYAITSNACEVLAVAMTGKVSAYSQWFRSLLVELGLPEWMLHLPDDIMTSKPSVATPTIKSAQKTAENTNAQQLNSYNSMLNSTINESKEEILQHIKSLIPDITQEELSRVSKYIDILKNNKNLEIGAIEIGYIDIDMDFISAIFKRIRNNLEKSKIKPMDYVEYRKMISNGKDILQMTDMELESFYRKLIPFINEEELNCLISQIHRIQNGETRFLNTPEENALLCSIKAKERCGLAMLKGINSNGGNIDYSKYPDANIPFIEKNLTELEQSALSAWAWSNAHPNVIKDVFNKASITLQEDTYLYRGLSTRHKRSKQAEYFVNYLNQFKEGDIIDAERHTSTAQKMTSVSTYSSEGSPSFGQYYILNIKVKKGTQVLDMRNAQGSTFDEIVLPPGKFKINKIDHNTGVIDCEFIPD